MKLIYLLLALSSLACEDELRCKDPEYYPTPDHIIEGTCATWPEFTKEHVVYVRIYPDKKFTKTWFHGSEMETHSTIPPLHGVEKLIVFHNHTNAFWDKFSDADIKAASQIKQVCCNKGVELYDFVLIVPGRIISMRKRGML